MDDTKRHTICTCHTADTFRAHELGRHHPLIHTIKDEGRASLRTRPSDETRTFCTDHFEKMLVLETLCTTSPSGMRARVPVRLHIYHVEQKLLHCNREKFMRLRGGLGSVQHLVVIDTFVGSLTPRSP